jgi:DNA-binding MarR family transcriptional regulator
MPGTAAPAARYLANDAWEALLSAHAVLMKELAAEDIWDEVSMREYDVLYALSKCRGSLRLSELNRHVLLSQPDPADGRGVCLSLTEAGRAAQRTVGRAHARSVARAMTGLDSAELAQLETICQKLARQNEKD